jgi:hypothetical protein
MSQSYEVTVKITVKAASEGMACEEVNSLVGYAFEVSNEQGIFKAFKVEHAVIPSRRIFEKCIHTYLGSGDDRVMFLLPYKGNLTVAKFDVLAQKFMEAVKAKGLNNGTTPLSVFVEHLRSEWLSVRHIGVTVERSPYGNLNIHGEGWMSINQPPESVVIVE